MRSFALELSLLAPTAKTIAVTRCLGIQNHTLRPTLDSPPCSVARLSPSLTKPQLTMGKQYNKVIKKKRRIAYLKRKKAATKKTVKTAKK